MQILFPFHSKLQLVSSSVFYRRNSFPCAVRLRFCLLLKVCNILWLCLSEGHTAIQQDLDRLIETSWISTKKSIKSWTQARMTSDTRRCWRVPSDRTKGNDHKPEHRRCHLNIRKHFFTVWVARHWQKLPKKAVESPTLKIFKSHLEIALGSLVWVSLLEQRGHENQELWASFSHLFPALRILNSTVSWSLQSRLPLTIIFPTSCLLVCMRSRRAPDTLNFRLREANNLDISR